MDNYSICHLALFGTVASIIIGVMIYSLKKRLDK